LLSQKRSLTFELTPRHHYEFVPHLQHICIARRRLFRLPAGTRLSRGTPFLEFKEYIQIPGTDSLQVVFSFTDGDGDIGVSPLDTNSNMMLTIYHKNAAGQWVVIDDPYTQFDPNDSMRLKYRIPKLAAGQTGLEGDIYLLVNKSVFINAGEDTLQFNGVLIDQSHNQSAYVRTPEIILVP
jgi:hypothetical protein